MQAGPSRAFHGCVRLAYGVPVGDALGEGGLAGEDFFLLDCYGAKVTMA